MTQHRTVTPHSNRLWWLASAIALSVVAHAPEARAGTQLGFEIGPLFPVGDAAKLESSTGLGFAGRVGYRLSLPLIALTPEVKLTYDRVPLTITAGVFRAMVGGRLAVGTVIAPVAFAHIGYGAGKGSEGGLDLSSKGLTLDAGAGLDFTLLPLLDLGVFVSYNKIADGDESLNWVSVGAQASIVF